MSNIFDDRKRALEEDYFRRKEQEAIERQRAKRAAQQQAEGAAAPAIRCPKCDGTLEEIIHKGVLIDRCNKCSGIWLDAGELDHLTEAEESGGFLSRLRRSISGE